MIKFLSRPEEPSSLSEHKVDETKKALRELVERGVKPKTSPPPSDFPDHWKPEARQKIWLTP